MLNTSNQNLEMSCDSAVMGKHQGGCGRSELQPPFYRGSLIIGSSISTVSPLMLLEYRSEVIAKQQKNIEKR